MKRRSKFPWVTASNWPEPSMHGESAAPYSLPMRTIADDERDLRPVENEATESPCVNGATCCAIIDIAGGPGMPLRALAPTLKFVFNDPAVFFLSLV